MPDQRSRMRESCMSGSVGAPGGRLPGATRREDSRREEGVCMLRTVCVRLALFFSLLAIARVGVATCDPSTDPDKSDIANARSAVAANCDCAGALTHGAYVSCAVQQANLVLVNPSCKGAV